MASVVTPAIVLHAFDYSESSRIVRLATREAGVQSVLARGARRSQKRFGAALDLFAEGEVQFEVKAGRDLHTLSRFDATRGRRGIGESLGRFEGAAALGEVMLRVAPADDDSALAYDVLAAGLDDIATTSEPVVATLRAVWRLLAAIGYAPALDQCVHCGDTLPADGPVAFAAAVGGALCDRCARLAPARPLPAYARDQLRAWLGDEPRKPTGFDGPVERAHRRLLSGFVHAHVTDGQPLRAFDAWVQGSGAARDGAPAGPAS
ncbi:MAG: DNA repair protein RecO [Gemmatimonadaceae bacterium]|jgi:DNA repair protein RecO (recombination protein O)|nr:DNA repair protein RecO [Gemmatimonadaceae bacterium]